MKFASKANPSPVDFLAPMKNRWSARAFSQEQIDEAALLRVLEAARWAPSSHNDQPWCLFVAQAPSSEYDQLLEILNPFNQDWAKTAPVLMLLAGDTISKKTGQENAYFAYDSGAAAVSMAIQAQAEGLYMHQMGGFSKTRAASLFELPETIKPLVAIALGKQGDTAQLPEPLQDLESGPRSRKELRDFVYSGKYGSAHSSLAK